MRRFAGRARFVFLRGPGRRGFFKAFFPGLCLRFALAFAADPGSVTACNCTICRRYGALWIYGWSGVEATTAGESRAYARGEAIDFHFCPSCGCLAWYAGRRPEGDGRIKVALNIRMADDPGAFAQFPIDHFDGLDSFTDLPRDGRRVADLWF